jgi:glyoxalase family protein
MGITGLHHITLVCANAQRTVDFYRQVLGQRLVKQTVNFDDPASYHLYFGNQTGALGSAITFFEWPRAPRGLPGIGGTHHFALRVSDDDGLLRWKRRLTDLGIAVDGPFDRHYFTSIYFKDPDGVILEIATDGPGFTVDEPAESLGMEHRNPPAQMLIDNRDEERIRNTTWGEPVPHITPEMALMQGMHHISAISANIERTNNFLSAVLGLRLVKRTSNFDDPASAHWYWGTGNGEPGTLITYFERRPSKTRRAQMGTGQTHHYAFAVPDEEVLLAFRKKMVAAGLSVSPVRDRVYFKSIYTNDPDGHVVELATAGPGFTYDETEAELGQKLMLPPWLESQRDQIEHVLKPIVGHETKETA